MKNFNECLLTILLLCLATVFDVEAEIVENLRLKKCCPRDQIFDSRTHSCIKNIYDDENFGQSIPTLLPDIMLDQNDKQVQ